MFSTLPTLPQTLFPGINYAPQVSSPLSSSPLRSSPLSPRDGNIPTRQFFMSSPTPTSKLQQSQFAKRTVKANPLIHNRNDGRETRRSLFLRKVREGSEDRRWEARGGDDEMMRTIWVAEEKRRIRQQEREAAAHVPLSKEEEESEPDYYEQLPSTATSHDDEMVDEVAQHEDAELDALLSMMESESRNVPLDKHEGIQTPYGSDDEDFDSWFMDALDAIECVEPRSETTQLAHEADHQMMDTAMDTAMDMS